MSLASLVYLFPRSFLRPLCRYTGTSVIQCLSLLIGWYRPPVIFSLSIAFASLFIGCFGFLTLGTVIIAKWALLGRCKVGNYDWDKSSNCQCWQIFLTIEMPLLRRLRRYRYGDGHILHCYVFSCARRQNLERMSLCWRSAKPYLY
jgi:hypothetical protein